MAYTKTTWKKGDVVTAEKLNNMETQIEELDMAVAALTEAVEALTPESNAVE